MSYTRIWFRPTESNSFDSGVKTQISGASGRNRTNDTRIFSPLLYLLSYRGILSDGRLKDSFGIIQRRTSFVNNFFTKSQLLYSAPRTIPRLS